MLTITNLMKFVTWPIEFEGDNGIGSMYMSTDSANELC